MRLVVQRVSSAEVEADGQVVGRIGPGLLVYVGVAHGDGADQASRMAEKVANLRIFEDEQGKLNLSVRDCGGAVLAVPNFTLLADARKGRRPALGGAASAEQGRAVYAQFVAALRQFDCRPATGVFGAHMIIRSVADGPVNIILETPQQSPAGEYTSEPSASRGQVGDGQIAEPEVEAK